jgi:chain length determinant protein EpsF
LGYIQTQVDILTSGKVARKVVDDLALTTTPSAQAQFAEDGGEGSIEDWLANNLLRDVEVKTSQSSIIDVSFIAEEPSYAASVANGFANAFIDTMLELRVEPTRQAASWFDEQLKTLRTDLESAQARLTDYQRRHGIVSADERVDIEHTRLSQLSSQLLSAQERTLVLRGQEQLARDALARGMSLEQLPEVQGSEHIQQLGADLLAGEARLEMLATQYGVNYPEYQRQLAENATRRAKVELETRKIAAAAASLRGQSERREAEIEAALDAQRSRLLEQRDGHDELRVLAGNVETAQKAYDTAMQRFVVSQVESRASQTNVALLNAAAVPTEPYRPKVALNVGLALVVGTLLGLGLVISMELSDRRVRVVADLDSAANVPMLGVLSAWEPPKLLLTGPSNDAPAPAQA